MKNRRLLEQMAFFSLLIVGIVFILTAIFTQLNLDLGIFMTILEFAREVAILLMIIVVVFAGWNYAKKQTTLWTILYAVAAVLAVVGTFMNLIG